MVRSTGWQGGLGGPSSEAVVPTWQTAVHGAADWGGTAVDQTTLDRIGAACGIPAVVLSPVGFALIASAGFGGGQDASREEVARAVRESSASLVHVGAVLDVLGAVFFVVFAARLYGLLRSAEGDSGWVSGLAFGGALLAIAGSFVDKAAYLALGANLGNGLDTAEAVTLLDISAGSFLLAQLFMGAVFLGGVAVVALRTGVLPAWLARSAGFVAIANLAAVALPPEAGFPIFFLFIVWMLVTSGYLVARPGARSAAAAAGA